MKKIKIVLFVLLLSIMGGIIDSTQTASINSSNGSVDLMSSVNSRSSLKNEVGNLERRGAWGRGHGSQNFKRGDHFVIPLSSGEYTGKDTTVEIVDRKREIATLTLSSGCDYGSIIFIANVNRNEFNQMIITLKSVNFNSIGIDSVIDINSGIVNGPTSAGNVASTTSISSNLNSSSINSSKKESSKSSRLSSEISASSEQKSTPSLVKSSKKTSLSKRVSSKNEQSSSEILASSKSKSTSSLVESSKKTSLSKRESSKSIQSSSEILASSKSKSTSSLVKSSARTSLSKRASSKSIQSSSEILASSKSKSSSSLVKSSKRTSSLKKESSGSIRLSSKISASSKSKSSLSLIKSSKRTSSSKTNSLLLVIDSSKNEPSKRIVDARDYLNSRKINRINSWVTRLGSDKKYFLNSKAAATNFQASQRILMTSTKNNQKSVSYHRGNVHTGSNVHQVRLPIRGILPATRMDSYTWAYSLAGLTIMIISGRALFSKKRK